MSRDIKRRAALAFGAGLAATSLLGRPAFSAPLAYDLAPKPIAEGVWMIEGANERITAGHSGSDLCLFEERSGLLIAGDVIFLDRAPTTPDADLPTWRASLDTLAGVSRKLIAPGHGPSETGRRGIDQTRAWLDMVEERVDAGFERGLDATELMAAPLPAWTDRVAVARDEFARSVRRRLPAIEAARLPTA